MAQAVTARPELSPEKDQRKERILTQPEPTAIPRAIEDAVLLKWGPVFLLTDPSGDVPWDLPHGLGLFFDDCRFLDGYGITLNGRPLERLSHAVTPELSAVHYLADPGHRGSDRTTMPAKHSLVVRRTREIRGTSVIERTRIRNHGTSDAGVEMVLRFRAGFEDIFQVRGFMPGPTSERLPARVKDDRIELRARGTDGLERATAIAFGRPPDQLDQERATFRWTLAAQQEEVVELEITPRAGGQARDQRVGRSRDASSERRHERSAEIWLGRATGCVSSNELFDRVMERAMLDLKLLRSRRRSRHFFAAGVPWFATLFGRDAAIAAIQTLPYGCRVAHDTLHLLASLQAVDHDVYRDAEPGKILHELRSGELARAGAIPQSPAYYGSVDATALFLILLTRYVRWSGDTGVLTSLGPALDAALTWLDQHADHDGDGYHDYVGKFEHGLVNQGWKDAGNSILREDGSLPEPPIALPEVQAYAYRAWRELAALYRDVGRPRPELDHRAEEMRVRFERDFWSDRLGSYVLALERGKRPIEVISSNAGQVLWGGIASAERAGLVAARLMAPDMFSGWGIRTISSQARAFHPVGYHLGSVWPHDNAMIAAGLRRYGCDAEAMRIFDAMAEAAMGARDERLPELFSGFERGAGEVRPVDYPNACRPQAWAAGTLPHLLWTMLGLAPDALAGRLIISRPRLPKWLDRVDVTGLGIGSSSVDLRFERSGEDGLAEVRTTNREGDLEVGVREDAGSDQPAL